MDIFQYLYGHNVDCTDDLIKELTITGGLGFTQMGLGDVKGHRVSIGCCIYGFSAALAASDWFDLIVSDNYKIKILWAFQKVLYSVLYQSWRALLSDKIYLSAHNLLFNNARRSTESIALLSSKWQIFSVRSFVSMCLPGFSFDIQQYVRKNELFMSPSKLSDSVKLGVNSMLGECYVDRVCALKIIVYANSQLDLERHLPNAPLGQKMWEQLRAYLLPYYKPIIVWQISIERVSCVLGRCFLGWTSVLLCCSPKYVQIHPNYTLF